jgi:hypothetical protein
MKRTKSAEWPNSCPVVNPKPSRQLVVSHGIGPEVWKAIVGVRGKWLDFLDFAKLKLMSCRTLNDLKCYYDPCSQAFRVKATSQIFLLDKFGYQKNSVVFHCRTIFAMTYLSNFMISLLYISVLLIPLPILNESLFICPGIIKIIQTAVIPGQPLRIIPRCICVSGWSISITKSDSDIHTYDHYDRSRDDKPTSNTRLPR